MIKFFRGVFRYITHYRQSSEQDFEKKMDAMGSKIAHKIPFTR